jgi:UDP-N-acetylglucosamine diphosphorylase/glucosamine-1-phosphate N-acetyltransferase
LPANICIFEDKKFANFLPLSLARPVFDLRVGCGTLRSRLLSGTGARASLICREYLAPVLRIESPGVPVNEAPNAPTLFVNGRWLALRDERERILGQVGEGSIGVKGGYVVVARVDKAAAADLSAYLLRRVSDESLDPVWEALAAQAGAPEGEKPKRRKPASRASGPGAGTYEDLHAVGQDSVEEKLPVELEKIIEAHRLRRVDLAEARLLSFPWQLIEYNAAVIADDFEQMPFRGQADDCVVYPGVHLSSPGRVVLGEKAEIRSGAVLDAGAGPIIVGDRARVMPNAVIIGPAFVGTGAIIKSGAKILEGTSVGPVCKVGGEVEETIFAACSNKQHDGFIGNSYIGEWVNIGAASNNSDLKNNYSPVRMWCAGSMRETGRQFLGLLMGDHTKTGINTLFNTGTVVGFNCNVFSSELPAKFVPSFSWGHGGEMTRYDLDRAMATAAAVMERRDVRFTPAHRDLFARIFAISERSGFNV